MVPQCLPSWQRLPTSDMAFPNCPSPAQAIPAPRAMPSKVLGVSREPQKPRARGTPKAPLPGGLALFGQQGGPRPVPPILASPSPDPSP